jgi:CDP-diacylglycerol---serine O-phosphatidyltransferase
MKQLPNIFTLLNLLFGCIAIVLFLQSNERILVLDEMGNTEVFMPERMWMGALFLFGAAVIDFLDGFIARAFRATSEMGKQLDSLSDVVSFGVAPGVIIFQLLRISYAQEPNGLDVPLIALIPAFLFSMAAAWRLAKFNISTDQVYGFRGVPTPAAGLFVASLPLIIRYPRFEGIAQLLINKWVLYGLVLVLAWLMVSSLRLMAMKFKSYAFADNKLKYLLVVLSVLCIVFLRWAAVPVIFVFYVLFSLVSVDRQPSTVDR